MVEKSYVLLLVAASVCLHLQCFALNSAVRSITHLHSLFKSNPLSDSVGQKLSDEINRRNDSFLKELSEPLLDYGLIKHTIEQWSRPLPPDYLNRPLVLVGPSGVGKGRLIKSLIFDYSRFFERVVTHTTRNPRPDEINGTSYHYISVDQFNKYLEQDGFFVEWAKVHNNFYGTSALSFQKVIKNGKIPIMEIDIQGAKTIHKNTKELGIRPRYIFIAPPDIQKLRDRLNIRGTETSEEIALRLFNAESELKEATAVGFFDEILVNDSYELTRNSFFRLLRDWYPKIPSVSRVRMLQRRIKKIKEYAQQQGNNNNKKELEAGLKDINE